MRRNKHLLIGLFLLSIFSFYLFSCEENIPEDKNPPQQNVEKILEEITVSKGKREFEVGDSFEKGDLVVTAKYSDNSLESITNYEIKIKNSNGTEIQYFDSKGEYIVVVSVKEKTTSYSIFVKEKIEKSIVELNLSGGKKNFELGDPFDKGDLVVTVKYSDNSSEKITNYTTLIKNSSSVSVTTLDNSGSYTVLISYLGKTASYTIEVSEPVQELESIEVNTQGVKLNYVLGEEISYAGLLVTANYTSTSNVITEYTKKITNQNNEEIQGPFEKTGLYTVIISYQNKTTSYDVFVDEASPIKIKNYYGTNEGAVVEFEALAGCSLNDYKISYQKQGSSTYINVDKNLIRQNENIIRADLLGLSEGTYNIKLVANIEERILSNVLVYAQDRSGYAHFNATSGVGAYNNDGTLKDNAVVVYVTNETKNTVTAQIGGKTYTGLVAILQAQSESNVALDIRIIGKITTNQWKPKDDAPRLIDNSNLQSSTFWSNEFETTYGDNLAGLTVKYMDKVTQKSTIYKTTAKGLSSPTTGNTSEKTTTYNGTKYSSITGQKVYDDDSYWNMLDVTGVNNVTIEGVGIGAEFFQWGLNWTNCNSIEIKNITFTDNTEDACSFEGNTSNPTLYGRYWIHNNVFNKGKNNWDVSGERDKGYGDGSTDFKGVYGVTSSYNVFNNCKKTGLVGGGDGNLTMNITFHHNYYNQVGSRLPLGRQANMHFYNNYYYKCSTCQDIRANAFVFSEANYFDGCTNAQLVTTSSTYTGTIIKSYQDYFTGGKTQSTKVTTRTESISGGACKPDGSTNYNNFDTNSTLFYYDTINKASNVMVLNSVTDVPNYVKTHAGTMTSNFTPIIPAKPIPQPEIKWATKVQETFDSSKTITKINEEDTPSSPGLFYKCVMTKANGTADTASTKKNIEISNGKLYINDTSETDTVYGYYMFDEEYSSGKVRISVDFIPTADPNGKWTMIHFLDGQDNFGVRSNDSKYLGYTLNNGETTTTLFSSAYSKNTTYSIVLTVDFEENSVYFSINGNEIKVTGYSPSSLKGIMFQTASASRSFCVDNIKIEIED